MNWEIGHSISANGNNVIMAQDIKSNKYDWVAGMAKGEKTLTVTVKDKNGKTATASVDITVK